MKLIATMATVFFLLTAVSVGYRGGSVPLTDAELAQIQGAGWCGFFDGVSIGLGTSAVLVAFVPGGQGFAVGAGVSAALLRVAIGLAC